MADAMESATGSEAKCSYSWWWDSHITPKNSKWLQENLTDMDNKIKSMTKLIEEDADSFARRAEMYYKKRPELMRLVEEFYRAYRALVERYDRVTGALRQAHRTISVAFPNQIQLVLPDEPPPGSSDPVEEQKEASLIQWHSDLNAGSPGEKNPFLINEEWKHLNSLLDDKEEGKNFAERLMMKGLNVKGNVGKNSEVKKLEEEVFKLSTENMNLKNQIASESVRAEEAETESKGFKDAIFNLKSQLEAAFLQYKVSQERISYLEDEISWRSEQFRLLNDEMSARAMKLRIAEACCLNLEEENRSLHSELSELKEALPRKMEEVSDLFTKNQNLESTLESETMRAEQAEVESCRLRDAILKLKTELRTSLLQYEVSQERISDLEDEISQAQDQFLQYEVSLERISDLEDEISRAQVQFRNFNAEMSIRSSKLSMAEEQYLVLQEENRSLKSTVDRFKLMVAKQEEESTMREEVLRRVENENQRYKHDGIQEISSLQIELNKAKQRIIEQKEELGACENELIELKQSLEDERQRRMIAESANQSLKKLHLQSEEKERILGMEIRSGAELRQKMELKLTGLEEELKRLHDENHDLNEKILSSSSKIACLQDEINSLTRSKLEIADELNLHLDKSKSLRQELSSLKNDQSNSEERHYELMEKMVEVNSNVVSLRGLLHGKPKEDALKNSEDDKLTKFEHLWHMEPISESMHFSSNLVAEMESLRKKTAILEGCCEYLNGNVEAIAEKMTRISEKNALFENSLSDVVYDFEGLRVKNRELDDSCKCFYHQNCCLIAENSNLAAQVEKIEKHMKSLENRLSVLEVKRMSQDYERELTVYQIEEMKNLFKSAEVDYDNQAFFENQANALNNQIHVLKEKNQFINEEFEKGLLETVNYGIDCFIMKQILYDINEKNKNFLDQCEKYIDNLRYAEKLNLHKMMDLMASVSDLKEKFNHIYVEKSSFTLLFDQLGLSLAELRANKTVLEQESEKKNEEILRLQDKNYELTEVNERQRMDLNASNLQKEELKIELEEVCRKLSDLPEAQCSFLGEIPKVSAESECISSNLFEIREPDESLEDEHESFLEEVMNNEQSSCNFRSSNDEKSSKIDRLINDVSNLHGITNDLGQDIRVINENIRALQNENIHLRSLIFDSEFRNCLLIEDGTDDIEKMSKASEKILVECSDAHPKFHNLQLESKKMFLQSDDLEKKIAFLSKDSALKDEENEFLRRSNEKFTRHISSLHEEAESLKNNVKNMASELHRSKEESKRFEEESASLLLEISAVSISELVFKQKIVELMLKVRSFEVIEFVQSEKPVKEVSSRHVQREDLMKKNKVFERETKGMKADMIVQLPLAMSLDKDAAFKEEDTLSVANDLILSGKRKQVNNLLPLHRKRFRQVKVKDHLPKVSAGIMEMKKLHSKVKQLQRSVTYTERLLAQEDIIIGTNLATETGKAKPKCSKGDKFEKEKKKDVVLDARKREDAGLLKVEHEVNRLKHDQLTKDIELDHVLSSSRSRDDFQYEIDERSRERSENPSFELVPEKEFSHGRNEADSHQLWSRRISETLSSDSLRMSILQENLQEMKKNVQVSETNGQSSRSALNTIAEKLKISEGVINQLMHINFKLTKMADGVSATMDDDKRRRQVSERVRRASEKINGVEVELENTQFVLSKLLEEEEETKALKALQRKSRFKFRDFIYGRRNDSWQKKRRFCCMRLNTLVD